jgi:hypothetical protein
MDHEAILEALAEIGDERHTARRADRDASRRLADMARRAQAAGIPKLRIAKTARISRTSLEAMLER